MRSFVLTVLLFVLVTRLANGQTVNPSSLNFGTVVLQDSRTLTTTLTNKSGAPIYVVSWSIANSADFSPNGPSLFTLNNDSSVTYTVKFAPAQVILPSHQHVGRFTINIQGMPSIPIPLVGYDHGQDTALVAIGKNYWAFADSDIVVSQFFETDLSTFADSIYTFDEQIEFDPNILNFYEVDNGAMTPAPAWAIHDYSFTPGTVHIATSSSGAALKGPGEILQLRFHVSSTAKLFDHSDIVQDNMNFGTPLEPLMFSSSGLVRVRDECQPVFLDPGPISGIEITPNPATTVSRVQYTIPNSTPTPVRMRLFDSAGRLISTLVDGEQTAGPHDATIDCSSLPNDVYTIDLRMGSQYEVRRLTVTK